MSIKTLVIEPRDPAIFRDGKPFALGLTSRSMGFAMPSTVMGSVRTRSGAELGFSEATLKRVMEIGQIGPFLAERGWANEAPWQVTFAAPADVVAYETEDPPPEDGTLEWHALRPDAEAEGSDLPSGLLPLIGAIEKKPAGKTPEFWHWDRMNAWLLQGGPGVSTGTRAAVGIPRLSRQKRVHVGIAAESQAAAEGMLFSTEGLEFSLGRVGRLAIVTRLENPMDSKFAKTSHIGGEGRTALWSEDAVDWPVAPGALAGKKFIRLILVTPGAFDAGWRPGWLNGDEIPGHPGLRLQLMAAAVPKPLPVSGWNLLANKRLPKASRLLAPAGSVYFCEVLQGDALELWLKPVSDRVQDRLDGFGIVIVGDWTWQAN